MTPTSITQRIEDYLAKMEGKISRKAHLVRIFLNKKNYDEFQRELNAHWTMGVTTDAAPRYNIKLYYFMGYLIEIVKAHEESIVIELRDEYKAPVQSDPKRR